MAEDLEPGDVAEARRVRGLMSVELAAMAGISRPTLRSVERGDRAPQGDTMWKIARAIERFDADRDTDRAARDAARAAT